MFAIITLFSFSFNVTYFKSKMDVSEIEACELNYLDNTKNNFTMDECDNQTETKTPFNPRHPVSGEN